MQIHVTLQYFSDMFIGDDRRSVHLTNLSNFRISGEKTLSNVREIISFLHLWEFVWLMKRSSLLSWASGLVWWFSRPVLGFSLVVEDVIVIWSFGHLVINCSKSVIGLVIVIISSRSFLSSKESYLSSPGPNFITSQDVEQVSKDKDTSWTVTIQQVSILIGNFLAFVH